MLEIDKSIIKFLNGYAARSELADKLVTVVLQYSSVKLLPVVAILVFLWFNDKAYDKQRAAVLQGITGAFLALIVSRLIQNFSPYRPRPLHSDTLSFVLPYGVSSDVLREWSSFPSDTTAVAFALATGIWCASRPLGWGCFLWSTFVVGLSRIYAGLHYPSDIAGGAVAGVLATLACKRLVANVRTMEGLQSAEKQMPGLFHCIGFVLLYQITTLFNDARLIASGFLKAWVQLFGG